MSSNDDFIRIAQSVPWSVYGFPQTTFNLVHAGWGLTKRQEKVVGIDLTYKGSTLEHTSVFIDITTLDAQDTINIQGARRSLEANLPLPLDQDYRLFQKYQLGEELRKSLGIPQIVHQAFSVLDKDFVGQLRVWPSLLLSRFLLFHNDVTVQGHIRGLSKEQLCGLLEMIMSINIVDSTT